ncbi:hypothetical protein EST38_g4898 [Candolleomyces aberdarensis]|uniref:Uncharacterized protein n=1 Tax=Candolleomyces aberdarensis TaxID=2316362 RepID=A0A4V1Q460_9AGAR|nr:hypothetical protein EST38_g4898 [Candolleomyces aberdarensis]
MPQQHSAIPDSRDLGLHRGPYSKTQARIDKLSAYPECEIVDGLMVNCLCCGISIALDVREKALKKGGYYTYNWEKHIRQISHSKALRAWNRKQRSMENLKREPQDARAETPVSDRSESRCQSAPPATHDSASLDAANTLISMVTPRLFPSTAAAGDTTLRFGRMSL